MRLSVLCLALAVAGCGPSQQSIEDFVTQAGVGMRGHVDPLPPPARYLPSDYTSAGMRDPFAGPPPPERQARRAPRGDPLERYALGALRMVGAIRRSETWVALVAAPDGTVHLVRRGAGIGQALGVIVAVSESRLVLVEPVVGERDEGERESVLRLVGG